MSRKSLPEPDSGVSVLISRPLFSKLNLTIFVLSFTITETSSIALINSSLSIATVFSFVVGIYCWYFGYVPSINLDWKVTFSNTKTILYFFNTNLTVSSFNIEIILETSTRVLEGVIKITLSPFELISFLARVKRLPSVATISKIFESILKQTPESTLPVSFWAVEKAVCLIPLFRRPVLISNSLSSSAD